MGKKGSKRGPEAEAAAKHLEAELEGLGDVTSRKMFGGVGIFESGTMFGIVDSAGAVYLRSGEANAKLFSDAGSHQHGKMPYFSVPDAVLGDSDALAEWGRAAIEASRSAKK